MEKAAPRWAAFSYNRRLGNPRLTFKSVPRNQARDYIALSNSEDVAAEVVLRILAAVEQLAAFPLSGRPGRVPSTRELVIPNTPFLAAYTVGEKGTVILAIYHGAQRWPEEF